MASDIYMQNKECAQKIVEQNQELVNELMIKGYLFYDQFKVTNSLARIIAGILDEIFGSSEITICAHEKEVGLEGFCGIIYVNKKYEDHYTVEELDELIIKHYT